VTIRIGALKGSSWVEFAGVVAAYLLIVFVLCPGNSLVGFPVHRDDFSNLAFDADSLRAVWSGAYPPRPVSSLALTALSVAGLPVYYFSLHALVVLYVFLSMTVLREVLGARPMPLLFAFLVGAAALSFECVVEYSKYTGLITNLLSGVFAMGAMSLMVAELKRSRDGTILRAPAITAIWVLCALSFWSKEDFILPTIVVAVYLACEARWKSSAERPVQVRWTVLAGGIVLLAMLLGVYNRFGHSAFTQAGAGPYKADFGPVSVLHMAANYLFMSPVAGMAAALQASTLIWNVLTPTPVRWMRLLLVQALIVLFALPYCFLPNHIALYYDFNWTVWQIGSALILLWNLSDRSAVGWAVAIIAVGCVAIGQPGRHNIAEWYRNAGQVNRNVVAALGNNSQILRPYRAVVIEGAPFLGPFASSGRFLSMRYGLDHDWIVRVPKNSEYLRTTLQLLGTNVQGRVRTVAMEDEPRPTGVPVLRLAPDGTGVLDLPGVAIKESDRVRIGKLHPDSTTVGGKFQVQPNGQSALAIEGANFQPGSIILFDGREIQTTYGNPRFITALVPDEFFSHPGVVKVNVLNPNGDVSQKMDFKVLSNADSK
jgi:hypothetical protein